MLTMWIIDQRSPKRNIFHRWRLFFLFKEWRKNQKTVCHFDRLQYTHLTTWWHLKWHLLFQPPLWQHSADWASGTTQKQLREVYFIVFIWNVHIVFVTACREKTQSIIHLLDAVCIFCSANFGVNINYKWKGTKCFRICPYHFQNQSEW